MLIAGKVIPGEFVDLGLNLYVSCRTSCLAVMSLFLSCSLCLALHLNFITSVVTFLLLFNMPSIFGDCSSHYGSAIILCVHKDSNYIQNHGIIEVDRHLWRSSSPASLLKQGQLEQVTQDCIQSGFEYL